MGTYLSSVSLLIIIIIFTFSIYTFAKYSLFIEDFSNLGIIFHNAVVASQPLMFLFLCRLQGIHNLCYLVTLQYWKLLSAWTLCAQYNGGKWEEIGTDNSKSFFLYCLVVEEVITQSFLQFL